MNPKKTLCVLQGGDCLYEIRSLHKARIILYFFFLYFFVFLYLFVCLYLCKNKYKGARLLRIEMNTKSTSDKVNFYKTVIENQSQINPHNPTLRTSIPTESSKPTLKSTFH